MLLFKRKKNRRQNSSPPRELSVTAENKTYQRVKTATMTSEARIVALCDAIDYLANARIEGCIVECGVWRGGSMMAAAISLLENNDTTRQLWLYDTFSGMSEPTDKDIDHLGNQAQKLLDEDDLTSSDSIWCYSELEEVQSNMESTQYPQSQIHYRPGPVERTLIEAPVPEKIALLRLDTDWYESTKVELEQLFPRLVEGGVLIIDDYGHWQGCQRAVDEYFANQNIKILLNRIDYTGRIGIKMSACNCRSENAAA